MELLNPISVEKIMNIGQSLALDASDRVIDFGCGLAEVFVLWPQNIGITRIGIVINRQSGKV